MSLSRPVKFPILKLPFLCIECVVKCCDIFDIIFFAAISKKTRRIVKIFRISLNEVEVYLTYWYIRLGNSNKTWIFNQNSCFEKQNKRLRENSLVLQKNAIPLYTGRTYTTLMSYTHQNLRNVLKMAMEFLNEVFNCSVETVEINGDSFPESGEVGVKSTVNLSVDLPFKYAQGQKLSLLLENLEVTGTCTLRMAITEKDFYVDPKLFKCKKLMFLPGSAAWVTREILLQFEVPQLTFFGCPFSTEDIVSFVTQWFHSDNKKLEYLYISTTDRQISSEKFQTEVLNPSSFDGRNRVPSSESFRGIDFSKGLEIFRHNGLEATIHVGRRAFLFYIWHNQ